MKVAEVLARYGSAVTEEEVAAILERGLRDGPWPAAAPMATDATAYLAEHGGPGARDVVERWSPKVEHQRRVEATVNEVSDLVASTLTVQETADRLGRSPSRVRHMLSTEGGHPQLFSVKAWGRRRVFTWQIAGGKPLPGLDAVIAAIPAEAHPLDVAAVMMTPQDETGGRTPVAHLDAGGDPRPVADLVAALTRW